MVRHFRAKTRQGGGRGGGGRRKGSGPGGPPRGIRPLSLGLETRFVTPPNKFSIGLLDCTVRKAGADMSKHIRFVNN